jgi:hypothetical protein
MQNTTRKCCVRSVFTALSCMAVQRGFNAVHAPCWH